MSRQQGGEYTIAELDALRVDILRGRQLTEDEQLELVEELRRAIFRAEYANGVADDFRLSRAG